MRIFKHFSKDWIETDPQNLCPLFFMKFLFFHEMIVL